MFAKILYVLALSPGIYENENIISSDSKHDKDAKYVEVWVVRVSNDPCINQSSESEWQEDDKRPH